MSPTSSFVRQPNGIAERAIRWLNKNRDEELNIDDIVVKFGGDRDAIVRRMEKAYQHGLVDMTRGPGGDRTYFSIKGFDPVKGQA